MREQFFKLKICILTFVPQKSIVFKNLKIQWKSKNIVLYSIVFFEWNRKIQSNRKIKTSSNISSIKISISAISCVYDKNRLSQYG